MKRTLTSNVSSYGLLWVVLLLCLPAGPLTAHTLGIVQSREITGRVVDVSEGVGLPGVNVIIKGTTKGTVTDVNGDYKIDVPDNNVILVFSSIGYIAEEVSVGNQSTINIQLVPDIQSLDEVVVIGYGEVNRRDLTGAVGQVNAEKINELPVAGFDEAIQGKLSGVRVINANAAPGGGFDIQVRGVGSLTSGGFPLIVVDGMPLQNEGFQAENNPFNLINPNDIESIEVLKDASSAAIYGARAANGVVLITTKRGKTGKATINFNASYGISQIINEPDIGTRDQYLQFYRDSRNASYLKYDPGNYNPGIEPSWQFDIETPEDFIERVENITSQNVGRRLFRNAEGAFAFLAWDTVNINSINAADRAQIESAAFGTASIFNNDEDWLGAIQRNGEFPGNNASYNLSASGGTDRARYLISGSYFKEEGLIQRTDYERITANLNLDFKVNDFITVGTKITPSWQDLNNIGGSRVEGRWFISPLYQTALIMPPIFNATDANGIPIDYSSPSDFRQVDNMWGTTFFGNPVYSFEQTDNRKTFRALANFWGEVTFLENFKFRTAILTDFSNGRNIRFDPSTYGDRFQGPGPQRFDNGRVNGTSRTDRSNKWYWENILTYSQTFNDVHNINAVAGYTSEETTTHFISIRKEGFETDDVQLVSVASIVEDQLEDATEGERKNSFIGILGRVQYNYKGKYYLSGSFRRDGSSRFGSETLWGNFPSVAAAWRISEEPFAAGLGFLDDLKLRASYGSTGNSSIPDFRQQRILEVNSYVIGNNTALTFEDAALFDPGLTWEKTEEINVGLDVGLLDSRLRITADWYQRTTEDMLLSVNLPNYSGFGSILQNFGEMENTGIELNIAATPVAGALTWTTDFNISHNRNKVTRLFQNEKEFIEGFGVSGGFRLTRSFTDGPMSVFWGTIFDGAFNDWDEINSEPSIFQYSNDADLFTTRRNSSHPGDLKILDVNGDGILSSDDRTVIGSPWPDFYWGFGNTVRFKNFDLYVQMDGIVGSEIYNAVRFENFRQGQRGFNMPARFFEDYWTPNNPDAEWPILRTNRQINSGWDNSALVEDGDYTAIRTVRLGYTLPANLVQKAFIQNFRVYINVQNAFYFTDYSGFNPEGNNRGTSVDGRARNFGVDGGNYPISRVITFGIDMTL